MALPYLFASATTATGPQLDANYAAVGALTTIPCAASGANTIVLTPGADTPTVSAYSNYEQFSGVAAQSNTGATTGKVGSLATLPVYKSSPGGPIPLVGGEIVANVGFVLMYDSALNTGGGGFHLMSAASAITAGGGTISRPLIGSGSLASISFPVATFPLLNGVTLASITRMSIGGGQTITHVLSTTASLTFSACNPQTSNEQSFTLDGCSVGDAVQLGYPSSIASQIQYRGYVNNPGTIAVVAMNYSASTITPTAGTYRATATGFTG